MRSAPARPKPCISASAQGGTLGVGLAAAQHHLELHEVAQALDAVDVDAGAKAALLCQQQPAPHAHAAVVNAASRFVAHGGMWAPAPELAATLGDAALDRLSVGRLRTVGAPSPWRVPGREAAVSQSARDRAHPLASTTGFRPSDQSGDRPDPTHCCQSAARNPGSKADIDDRFFHTLDALERPRVFGRLRSLRGWSHEEVSQVLP
jgi:hypothetical protein